MHIFFSLANSNSNHRVYKNNLKSLIPQSWDEQTFPVKGQGVGTLSFSGHTISVIPTDNIVPRKLYLGKQEKRLHLAHRR